MKKNYKFAGHRHQKKRKSAINKNTEENYLKVMFSVFEVHPT